MDFNNSNKLKAVTFSFDDGVTQDIYLIEMLNKYGLKATFNLNSGTLGKGGTLDRLNKRISFYKIMPDDVKYIYEGHEVSTHSLTHPNLTRLAEEDVVKQVEQDRLKLSELAGYEVVGHAYPIGYNDDRTAGIIKEKTGIKYARTVTPTDSFDRQENLYRFNPNVHFMDYAKTAELAKKFLETETEKPQILYVWGHSFELDYDNKNREKFEEFLKMISGHPDIFYGTNKEVLL